MRRLRYGALTAVALTALVTGCTSGDGGSGPGTGRDDTRQSPATGPVLAVKIDNVAAARPQTGLGTADVVYVEQVEGGLSRLMAVYATRLPEVIGPVRSARESDLELLRQFDDPTLAFSGAQRKLLPLIDAAPLRPAPPGKAPAGAYFRGRERPMPHNLYLRPAKVMDTVGGRSALSETGFRFGAAPGGGTPERERTVRFPAARYAFTWSERRGAWLVTLDGTPDRTTDGKTLAPATVVVQYVRIRESPLHDRLGSRSPYTETVGSGTADVLRDGRTYRVRWEREKARDGTEFTTADGKRVGFASGQVWVLLVAAR